MKSDKNKIKNELIYQPLKKKVVIKEEKIKVKNKKVIFRLIIVIIMINSTSVRIINFKKLNNFYKDLR